MGMFDTEDKKSKVKPKSVIKEDASTDTSIPYLTMGGVFTKKVGSLSDYVNLSDDLNLRKAVMDFFNTFPNPSEDQVKELADRLGLGLNQLNQVVYSIMSSFFNAGQWVADPNIPIDPDQLTAGTNEEREHSSCPLIARRIALDHLAKDPTYYTKLAQIENKKSTNEYVATYIQ